MKFQTKGFVVIGVLPNEEGFPCLVCKTVPESIFSDLFVPSVDEIPESVRNQVETGKDLAVKYRLCPKCREKGQPEWKIRLLILARLNQAGAR